VLGQQQGASFASTFLFYSLLPLFGILPTLYGLYVFRAARKAAKREAKRIADARQLGKAPEEFWHATGEMNGGRWGKKLKQLLEVNPMFAKHIFRTEDKVEKNARGLTVTSNPALSTQVSKASKIGSVSGAEGIAFDDFLRKDSDDTTAGSFNPMKENSELHAPVSSKSFKLPEPPENRDRTSSLRSSARASGSSWVCPPPEGPIMKKWEHLQLF
ncbi:hypothetical protein CYMTET_35545, partial [Cymbomonas tetramitiformis]